MEVQQPQLILIECKINAIIRSTPVRVPLMYPLNLYYFQHNIHQEDGGMGHVQDAG